MANKVIVTKNKLDTLATSVAIKSRESIPLTIDEMKLAVDSILPADVSQDDNGYVVLGNTGYSSDLYTMKEIADRKYCTGITGKLVLNVTTIFPYQFEGCLCTSLSSKTLVSANDGHGVGSYIFAYCPNLESVDIPNFTGIGSGGYHFAYCTKLKNVYMPKTVTGQHMFDGCTSLVNIAIPNFGHDPQLMNSYAFRGCTSLEKVDLGNISRIDSSEFSGCTKLNVLVLRRSDAITTLRYTNAFDNTCFKSGGTGGTIYIPKSLYDHLGDGTALDYQSATNWSTIYGYGTINWEKIEGSVYENFYVDGREVLVE